MIIQKITNPAIVTEKDSIVLCLDKEIEPYRKFISDETFSKIIATSE